MKRPVIVTSSGVLLGALSASAAPVAGTAKIEPQAATLLNKTAAKYRGLRSYSDVTELRLSGAAKVLVDGNNFRARLAWVRATPQEQARFQFPRVRVEKRDRHGRSLAVSDGQTVWAKTAARPSVYLKRAANFNTLNDTTNEVGVGAPGFVVIMSGQGLGRASEEGLTSLKMGPSVTVARVPCRIVEAHNAFPSGGDGVTRHFIGARDGLVHRVTQSFVALGGRRIIKIETHSQIRVNPPLPASMWQFVPPAKARAVEYFTSPADFEPKVKVGQKAPDFQLRDWNNGLVSLRAYRGRVVLLHFWSTWESTASDVPQWAALYRRYHARGLDIIGVSLDARRERVAAFLEKTPVPYPIIFDGGGWKAAIAQQYGVKSLPTALLIGRDGVVRSLLDRPGDARFEPELLKALAQPTP